MHVLIYCAVIRIQSVIIPRRIKSFIEDYFTDTPINAFTSSGRLTSPHAKLESIVYKPDARNPTRLRCHGTIIVFSTPDGSTQNHIINSLITRLLSLFNSRYVINRWERRHIYKDDSEPSARTYAKRAALDDHYELASILYTAGLAKDALKYWPPQDVVPDRRDEEARIYREGPTTVVWDPKDVPMFEDEDDTEAKNALALMKVSGSVLRCRSPVADMTCASLTLHHLWRLLQSPSQSTTSRRRGLRTHPIRPSRHRAADRRRGGARIRSWTRPCSSSRSRQCNVSRGVVAPPSPPRPPESLGARTASCRTRSRRGGPGTLVLQVVAKHEGVRVRPSETRHRRADDSFVVPSIYY